MCLRFSHEVIQAVGQVEEIFGAVATVVLQCWRPRILNLDHS